MMELRRMVRSTTVAGATAAGGSMRRMEVGDANSATACCDRSPVHAVNATGTVMWGAGAVTVAVAAPTIVRRIGDPAMLRLGAGAATVAVAVGAFLVFRRI